MQGTAVISLCCINPLRRRIRLITEPHNHTMDMSLNTGFAVPTECAVRKVNMNTETFIKRLPNSCDLFALGNGIGRHKRCPNGGSLHQLCRLEIPNPAPKRIYTTERYQEVENINPYLLDAPNVFIDSRTNSICNVPQMVYGNKPTDGGFLFLSPEERDELLKREPGTEKFIRQIYGATEYINNKARY